MTVWTQFYPKFSQRHLQIERIYDLINEEDPSDRQYRPMTLLAVRKMTINMTSTMTAYVPLSTPDQLWRCL
jgi:hypothetical protein